MTCQATFSFYCGLWSSGQSVRVSSAFGNSNATQTAIGRWASALTTYGSAAVPSLVWESTLDSAEVLVQGVTSGSTFCGTANEQADPVTITLHADGTCSGNSGTKENVLGHELGHAYGWLGANVDKVDASKIGKSDHCAQVLPTNGSINSTICAHMIEGARAAYGSASFDAETFWAKEFAIGPAIDLVPDTVEVGAALQLLPGGWRLDRGGTTSGGYTWTSSDTNVATVSSGGVVTGIAAGTATIRLFPTSSSTYYFSYRFAQGGFTVPITVVPAAPIPLVVTNISRSGIDTLPIYNTGSYTFTAQIGHGDTTGVYYRWIFKDSRQPNDSVVVGDTSPPFTFGTRTASYTVSSLTPTWTLWVKAIPMRESTTGSPSIREWAVCVEPITEYLVAETPEPPSTDAVGGCDS